MESSARSTLEDVILKLISLRQELEDIKDALWSINARILRYEMGVENRLINQDILNGIFAKQEEDEDEAFSLRQHV